MERRKRKINLWNRRWIWTLIFLVLFTILSAIKVVVLPQGGAVTYFSLLAVWLVTYFFGFRYGLLWSVLFGFVRLGVNYCTGEFINYAPMALLLEYPLGYGVFALGGLLKEPGNRQDRGAGTRQEQGAGTRIVEEPFKLKAGYVLGVWGQFVLFVISAVCFYPPDKEGFLNNLLFCILYDGSYLLLEGAVTFLFLCIPPVQEAVYYLKHIATNKKTDEALLHF